jgi:hypothetical protein
MAGSFEPRQESINPPERATEILSGVCGSAWSMCVVMRGRAGTLCRSVLRFPISVEVR